MERKNIGSVLIEADGEISGIITERDLLTRIVARAADPQRIKVREIMNPLKYTIDEEADILDASHIFQKFDIRRLPVTRSGKIVGIITTRDIAKAVPYALSARITRMHALEETHPLDY